MPLRKREPVPLARARHHGPRAVAGVAQGICQLDHVVSVHLYHVKAKRGELSVDGPVVKYLRRGAVQLHAVGVHHHGQVGQPLVAYERGGLPHRSLVALAVAHHAEHAPGQTLAAQRQREARGVAQAHAQAAARDLKPALRVALRVLEDARVRPKQAAVYVVLAYEAALQHHGVQRHGRVRLAHDQPVALVPRRAVPAGVHHLVQKHGHNLCHRERTAKVQRASHVAVPPLHHAATHRKRVQVKPAAQGARGLVLRGGALARTRANAVQLKRAGEAVALHGHAHDGLVGPQPREAPLYGRAVRKLDVLLKHHHRVRRAARQARGVLGPRAARRVVHVRKRDLAPGAPLHRVKQRLRSEVRLLQPRARLQVRPALLAHHGPSAHRSHAPHKQRRFAGLHLKALRHLRRSRQHVLLKHLRRVPHAAVAKRRRKAKRPRVSRPRDSSVRHHGPAPLAAHKKPLRHQRPDRLAHGPAAHAVLRHQVRLRGNVAPPPPLAVADLAAHDLGKLHVQRIGRIRREERGLRARSPARRFRRVRGGKAKVVLGHEAPSAYAVAHGRTPPAPPPAPPSSAPAPPSTRDPRLNNLHTDKLCTGHVMNRHDFTPP